MDLVDVYDGHRRLTGRIHRRGDRLAKGDYILVVCVWVSDGRGRLLLTLRAPEKLASPNAWENSGGAALAGETGSSGRKPESWPGRMISSFWIRIRRRTLFMISTF